MTETTDLSIPKRRMLFIVKEILSDLGCKDFKLQLQALEVLREAAEAYIVAEFQSK